MNIPDTDLMAEKLGIVMLCENCGGRIEEIRDYVWVHFNNKCTMCPSISVTHTINPSTTIVLNSYSQAKPRKI
jgi:hypothetical protein